MRQETVAEDNIMLARCKASEKVVVCDRKLGTSVPTSSHYSEPMLFLQILRPEIFNDFAYINYMRFKRREIILYVCICMF